MRGLSSYSGLTPRQQAQTSSLTKDAVLRQRAVADGVRSLVGPEMVHGDTGPLVHVLIMQDMVAMAGRGESVTPSSPFSSLLERLESPLQPPKARLYLNVPLSTSWPLRRMWMPSLSREPNAMYSARAQSTVRFFTISPRVFRIRLKPARTEASS